MAVLCMAVWVLSSGRCVWRPFVLRSSSAPPGPEPFRSLSFSHVHGIGGLLFLVAMMSMVVVMMRMMMMMMMMMMRKRRMEGLNSFTEMVAKISEPFLWIVFGSFWDVVCKGHCSSLCYSDHCKYQLHHRNHRMGQWIARILGWLLFVLMYHDKVEICLPYSAPHMFTCKRLSTQGRAWQSCLNQGTNQNHFPPGILNTAVVFRAIA